MEDLHGRETPIVHRDIKPENILVSSIDPLYIKFADFGLSKASIDLKTFCGTNVYLAPEVYSKKSYTPAIDIWSLSVVAFNCACGLPDNRGYQGRDWCELLIDQINDWENGDLIDLLSKYMVVMNPKLRGSAQTCFREVSRLTLEYQQRCSTPTPSSNARGPEEALSPGRLAPDPDMLGSHPKRSSRRRRANAPSPHTHASTRKRSKLSLSSSGKRHTKRPKRRSSTDSRPIIDLFGEGWLQDPNCVGSSVAAMGQESSHWSSCQNQTTMSSRLAVPQPMADCGLYQGGYASTQYGHGIDTIAYDRVETVSADSIEQTTARMLQAMDEAGYL